MNQMIGIEYLNAVYLSFVMSRGVFYRDSLIAILKVCDMSEMHEKISHLSKY